MTYPQSGLDRLTWVRNFGYIESSKSATSLWHLLHSVRVVDGAPGFALTYCGQNFYNPRSRYDVGRARKCSNCLAVARALLTTAEVPDTLVIREDGE